MEPRCCLGCNANKGTGGNRGTTTEDRTDHADRTKKEVVPERPEDPQAKKPRPDPCEWTIMDGQSGRVYGPTDQTRFPSEVIREGGMPYNGVFSFTRPGALAAEIFPQLFGAAEDFYAPRLCPEDLATSADFLGTTGPA